MIEQILTPGGVVQTVIGAVIALTVSTWAQRRGWVSPPAVPLRSLLSKSDTVSRPDAVQPLSSSSGSAGKPPPLPARPTQLERPPLAIKAIAADLRSAHDEDACFEVDANGHSIRPARARRKCAHEKTMQVFMDWMIREDCSGWYTPKLIYDAFQEFAWQHHLEEIDYRSFLSYLVVQPGVDKKRAYVKINETFRHLRRYTNGQDRAIVYRIPTAPELAAATHKAEMRAAAARLSRPGAGPNKSRPATRRHGIGHEHPPHDHKPPVAQKSWAFDVDDRGYEVAA